MSEEYYPDYPQWPSEYVPKDITLIAENILGICGRMISRSKSAYKQKHSDNIVVFNANVCIKSVDKIWYGDLDITLDKQKLEALAQELKEDVYVLYESDARFDNENSPLYDQAVEVIRYERT